MLNVDSIWCHVHFKFSPFSILLVPCPTIWLSDPCSSPPCRPTVHVKCNGINDACNIQNLQRFPHKTGLLSRKGAPPLSWPLAPLAPRYQKMRRFCDSVLWGGLVRRPAPGAGGGALPPLAVRVVRQAAVVAVHGLGRKIFMAIFARKNKLWINLIFSQPKILDSRQNRWYE